MDESASGQTWLLATVVILWIAAQYGLAIWALRDLWQRPRVRGDNKVLWALLILILPILGPILYSSLGPASFLPRSTPRRPRFTRPGFRRPVLRHPGLRRATLRRPDLLRGGLTLPGLRHLNLRRPNVRRPILRSRARSTRKGKPPSGA